ncbi:MAG: response regulator [Cyanobacteria bacterium P01_F01_bin.53]
MIDAWEQLEIAIARNPVVVSLDAKVLDAMVAMRGQSGPRSDTISTGLSSQSVNVKADDDFNWDTVEPDDEGVARSSPEEPPMASYVVIVEHDQVVGLLTEQDIGRLAVQQVPLGQLTIRQTLRRPPVTIKASALSELSDLVAVLNLFQQHRLSHLPVLDNAHRLVGVISSESLHRVLRHTLTTTAKTAHTQATHTQTSRAEIARTEMALQDSQKQFQHLAENIPGMIYRLVRHFDGDYELTYVSSQVEEMFEVDPKTMLQNINNFWGRIHPDDLDWLHTEIQVSARTLQPFRSEHRLSLPEKGLRWVKMIAHPEQVENGDVIWDGVVLDIGDRKQAKAELKRTSQELDRATRLKDEFLANMSHELRTPLNAILGMTEGLQDGVFGQINPQQLKTLQTIEQSGSHQLALINEILDLAKIESGNLELAYSAVSVTHLCQSSLAAVKQQSLEKGIQLHLNIPWNLPDIRVDEHRIRQVLVHLLNNAVNFTLTGGNVTLEVMPSLLDENQIQHYLRFVVADSGIGLGADGIKPLFQPFVDTEDALKGQYEGTGLGLSLVKRIVELHGGQVAISNDANVGNCFAIELPYDTTAATLQIPQSKTVPSSDEDTPPTEAPLILLAEDNEANIIAPSSYLQAKGYRIQVAKNGQAAIDLAQSEVPNVILMDIKMPGMDGLTAIQRIRQLPALAQTPIIALTAFAMEGDQERCLAAGADKYLSKPVKLKQLVSSIQELMRQ